MAQLVKTQIKIGKLDVNQFTSLTLSQGIFAHHTFRLACPMEAIDNISGSVFENSKNLVGDSIDLQIVSVDRPGTLHFIGVVTQVEAVRQSGHTGDIIISGFSPSILLDNGPHCKSWEEQPIQKITEDVLGHFPKNLLQPVLLEPGIKPVYKEKIPYTVQYKETAWQFLNRLSASYGEWFFYDGVKLVLGSPKREKTNLVYGSNLGQFSMGLQLLPASFKMMAYDYINNEVYDGTPTGIAARAGLNKLGIHTLQKSEQFYNTKPKQWHNQFLTDKNQLEDYVNTRAAAQSSNMVRFNGSSDHPAVRVGGTVNVQADKSFDDYTVISINHYCDGQGYYSNDFVAIPATIQYPPVTSYVEPICETQSAVVTDNHDKEGLGRIRVKFHWMNGTEKSPWLRIASPHGGAGKGMFFIPEKGEEVIVGFEGDSAVKPFIIGTVYNGKAKNESGNSGNDIKAIQTRSGNKIVMNDKDESIHVSDAKGNDMLMDGKGNIKIASSESMVFTCGNSKIEMKKDGTISINGKIITATASEKATMESGGASFTADGKKSEANMAGTKANVTGSSEAKMNGGAKATVSAGGKVDVKAGIIALN